MGVRAIEKFETLEFVFQMMDRFGVNAELRAGDEMGKALELGDVGGFNEWCLIAETIATLRRTNLRSSDELDQPAEPSQSTEWNFLRKVVPI
jgi:hypothetical protein